MHITSIGIDLGKTTFHLVALGERNQVLVGKKFSRTAVGLHGEPAGITGWSGSLCGSALDGSRTATTRA